MREQECKHCLFTITPLWGKHWVTAATGTYCSRSVNEKHEPATPSGEVAQPEEVVHSKGSAVVQEQWERSKWSHHGNWRESLGDWAADLLTEYAAKYGPIDAAQPEPQPAGTERKYNFPIEERERMARASSSSWQKMYVEACAQLAALKQSHTQCVDALKQIRKVRVGTYNGESVMREIAHAALDTAAALESK